MSKESRRGLRILVGEAVQLPSSKWVVAVSLDGSCLDDIESVNVFDGEQIEERSSDRDRRFYVDFEIDTFDGRKVDCRIDLLGRPSITRTIELMQRQQIIKVTPEEIDLAKEMREEIPAIGLPLTPKELMKSKSILFLAASPTNASALRLGKEFAEIQSQLKMAIKEGRFKLELPQLALRTDIITSALLEINPQIVHFSGHGTPDGELCFENESGEVFCVPPEALATLFELFAHCVECVVLNACYSKTQAEAIAEHINYVIGTEKEISDGHAIAFSLGFYQALGAESAEGIERAFELGCTQAELKGNPKELRPILIKKKL